MYSTTVKVSFLLAIFGMALGATVVKPELVNTNPFPHFETDEVFTCGGVIREASEQILYKPFRQAEANERCIWIVAAPGATAYRVRLHQAGSTDHVNVAGVSNGWPGWPVDLVNSGSLSSAWTNISHSTAMVITFHTSNETSTTGFALEYEVAGTGSYTPPTSTYSIVDADTISVKHPEGRDTYQNSEVSIFALPPLNNVLVEGRSRQVVYNRLELESCYDKLSVYHFNTATNRYDLEGTICDDTKSELIKSTDASLLIFRTDNSVVRAGFNLAFTNCGD